MSEDLTTPEREHRGDAGSIRADERLALARLRRWGGPALVHEMAELYLAQMPERLAAARLAVSRADPAGLARALHSIRSSSAQLGASSLVGACEAAEAAAESGALDLAVSDLARVEAEYAAFREWLGAVTSLGDATGPFIEEPA